LKARFSYIDLINSSANTLAVIILEVSKKSLCEVCGTICGTKNSKALKIKGKGTNMSIELEYVLQKS